MSVASVTSLIPRGAPPGAVRSASELSTPSQAVGQRVLPVHAELANLLPHRGLRRGSTVVVRGSTTVLLALLALATSRGSWAAVVGMPDLGLLAASELGVAVHRLALVPDPGAQLGSVVAALLDGVDLVVVAGAGLARAGPSGAGLARRLSARARHRGAVLIPFGQFPFGQWPGADLELSCTRTRWSGLGVGFGTDPGAEAGAEAGAESAVGHGHLAECELALSVRGRGVAARPTYGGLSLSGGGGLGPVPPTPEENSDLDLGVKAG